MIKEKKISMKAQQQLFADTAAQIKVLEDIHLRPSFGSKLKDIGFFPLKPITLKIFQVNMGKMCNQVCKHCHVDAGPDRKEIMTKETMQQCLNALDKSNIQIVDLTGGAPEMNPNFRWFVEKLSDRGKHIIVRCNLTIVLANKKYNDLPEFFKKYKIEVVSSLPHFSMRRTDAQRGEGVFEKSIKVLQILNKIGYGKIDSDLKLSLVYNPSGAFLPGNQTNLEAEFKTKLMKDYNVEFNQLFAITNLPISRFLDYLVKTKNYETYIDKLIDAYNPSTVMEVMCRSMISIGWDGYLFDCDFNQMLDLKLQNGTPGHIKDFDVAKLETRDIIVNNHCYGCTAGAGSSCGGQTI